MPPSMTTDRTDPHLDPPRPRTTSRPPREVRRGGVSERDAATLAARLLGAGVLLGALAAAFGGWLAILL